MTKDISVSKVTVGKVTLGIGHPDHPDYKEPELPRCGLCSLPSEGRYTLVDSEGDYCGAKQAQEPKRYPICIECAEDMLGYHKCPDCGAMIN